MVRLLFFDVNIRVGLLALTLAPVATVGEASSVAFPGAEGYGAKSVGGRGGRVIEVTNLNDSGPGSMRACVEASGPRMCVFRVAGYIDLEREIIISHPYLTVAGQTAPGGGIYLRMKPGKTEGIGGLIEFKRFPRDYKGEVPHDVIIRYIKFRHGRSPTRKGAGARPKNLEIWSGHNIMIDHITSGWVQDNLITLIAPGNGSPPVHDITVQRSLFAEALEGHATGMNIQGQGDENFQRIWNIAVHHNLFASNTHRNPRTTSNGSKIVNNVAYNWSNRVGSMTRGSVTDWINNYWKAGPMSNRTNRLFHEDRPNAAADPYRWTPSIYIAGNIAPNHIDPNADNWPLIRLPYDNFKLLPSSFRRHTPLPQAAIPITIQSANDAFRSVLNDVGANARLDCAGNWVANSDSIDSRVINEVRANTGPKSVIAHQDDVGGYPATNPGIPCADSDHDGMPDAWETANGFNPGDSSDGTADADGDGYTNVEEFLNGTTP